MAAALGRHLGHRGRRHCDHRQVHRPGQVVDGRHAGDALHGPGVRIDRIDGPGEAAGHDVAQDGPAECAAAPARAHHGDRSRPQQRAQARHVRPAFPAGHRLQVMAQPVIVVAVGQGEGQLDHATGYPPLRGQAGIREYPQHRRVLRQRLGGESLQVALPGQPDQVLEQQAGDAAAVHVIRHGERDLRDAGLPGQLVGGDADQPVALPGQQRRMVGIRLAADPLGFPLGRARAHAEKPQVHVFRCHGRVHRAHRLMVLPPGWPDLHRTAVGQQRVRVRGRGSHRPAPLAGGTASTGHCACPRQAAGRRPEDLAHDLVAFTAHLSSTEIPSIRPGQVISGQGLKSSPRRRTQWGGLRREQLRHAGLSRTSFSLTQTLGTRPSAR